ncbi:MAG TPA: hypothetical protein VGG22_12545 [Candidatus Baltobacteraceae bacterium]|jgi:hypothetical protein
MRWIRPAGFALAMLLLMTSPAVADSPVQQLESSVRASLSTVGTTDDAAGLVRARPSIKTAVAPEVTQRAPDPLMTVVHRVMNLTGGWRLSAGISPGMQILGVTANGRVVEDHWMNFHISVGLPLR